MTDTYNSKYNQEILIVDQYSLAFFENDSILKKGMIEK